MAKGELQISVPSISIGKLEVEVEGLSPLICHKWSEKAKEEMRGKQGGKARPKKMPKVPQELYEASLYSHPEGGYGFPAIAFKKAMTSACRYVDGVPMTIARGAFFVEGELVKIEGQPNMREDMVRLQGSTADIRYRGEFKKWRTKLILSYNANALSPEQIVNLLNIAGFAIGVGEHRPDKDGPYGRFQVVAE